MSKELKVVEKRNENTVNNPNEAWFYSNIVKDHFFNPRNFLKDKKDIAKYDGYGNVGNILCGDRMDMWIKVDKKTDKIIECKWLTWGSLVPGSELIMDNLTGKKVEELKINDKIIDGNGKKNIIDNIFQKNYSGKIITFKLSTSNFYTISVTPSHPIPCVPRKDVVLVNRRSKERWSEVIKGLINGSEINILPASDLKQGDFLIYNILKDINDINELNEEMCTLLGYYVSDGTIHSKNRVGFYFNIIEERYINEIKNIADNYKWKWNLYKRKNYNCFCLDIFSPELVLLLSKYGGTAGKKRFAEEVLLLPTRKQMLIIDAYLKDDGWEIKLKDHWNSQCAISTSVEHLAYQLQIMLARNWIFAPIHKKKPKKFTIRGKNYINKGGYVLVFQRIREHSRIKMDFKNYNVLIPISKIIVSNYKGKIYDVSIKSPPHIYKVRGISIHNCASAIASTSMLSEIVTEKGGMKIDDALKLKPIDVIKRLGNLPKIKYHCSVLGDQSLRAAIYDYFKKSKQQDRIKGRAK